MSAEHELMQVTNAIVELDEAFRNGRPITVLRMDYLLDRVRTAGIRMIDARIDEAVRP